MRPRFLVEAEAEAELDEDFSWYEGGAKVSAPSSRGPFERPLPSLPENPEQFPYVRGDVRRALVRRFPYAVCYVAEPDQISILAVIHTRRHPGRWQSRR